MHFIRFAVACMLVQNLPPHTGNTVPLCCNDWPAAGELQGGNWLRVEFAASQGGGGDRDKNQGTARLIIILGSHSLSVSAHHLSQPTSLLLSTRKS